MSSERPPVWVGHVSLRTAKLDESEAFMKQIGLRPVFRGEDIAVLELRGGTHLVLAGDPGAEPAAAPFDLMVEDVDATRRQFAALGLAVGEMRRGRIHDSFEITEPGGNRIVVNSSHVSDHSQV